MENIPKSQTGVSGRVIFRLLLLVVVSAWLGGCAPKRVVIAPSSPPVAAVKPSISDVLRAQYEEWKGVPHRIGGTDKRGVDCSGLVLSVFRDAFRLELPRTSVEQSRVGRPVLNGDLRPGDLVFFYDKGGDHIGIMVEKRVFLHASATIGVTLSELDQYWLPRLKRVQRLLPS